MKAAIEHSGSGSIEAAVEGAAARLGATVGETWRLINTGELSCEETADGSWIVPEWSLDYLLKDRAGPTGTPAKPKKAIVLPAAPPPEKKKTKTIDPAKKWKQRFDAMGKEKNGLTRRVRAAWQLKDDPQSEKKTRELQRLLDKAKRELVEHVEAGVRAGFIEPTKPPEQRSGRKKAKAGRSSTSAPKLDLAKLGLQVGVSFAQEREILNAFDPRRKLEAWERPLAPRGGSYQRPDK